MCVRTIPNVVLRDRDINFQDQTFQVDICVIDRNEVEADVSK